MRIEDDKISLIRVPEDPNPTLESLSFNSKPIPETNSVTHILGFGARDTGFDQSNYAWFVHPDVFPENMENLPTSRTLNIPNENVRVMSSSGIQLMMLCCVVLQIHEKHSCEKGTPKEGVKNQDPCYHGLVRS